MAAAVVVAMVPTVAAVVAVAPTVATVAAVAVAVAADHPAAPPRKPRSPLPRADRQEASNHGPMAATYLIGNRGRRTCRIASTNS